MQLLQCIASLPGRSGQWNSCNAPPHCPGQWTVQLVQCSASLLGGGGQWTSCDSQPPCLGAGGRGTSPMHCLTA